LQTRWKKKESWLKPDLLFPETFKKLFLKRSSGYLYAIAASAIRRLSKQLRNIDVEIPVSV
jgi:hypothetical protein